MNIIERQTELSKSLYEINTNTLKETFSLQKENVQKYFETTREFGGRFPEVKDVSGFISLQREFSETLWNNAVAGFKAQSEIVKSAVEGTSVAVKTAFTQEDQEETAEIAATEAKVDKPVKKSVKKAASTAASEPTTETQKAQTTAEEKPKAKAKAKPKARARKAPEATA